MQVWLCTVWKMYFNFVGESSPLRARFALLSGHPADLRSLSCLPYPILPICTGTIPQTLEPEYLPLMKFRYRSSFSKGKQSYLNLSSKMFLWNWYVFWSFKMGQFDIIVYSVNRLRVLLDMNIIVLGHSNKCHRIIFNCYDFYFFYFLSGIHAMGSLPGHWQRGPKPRMRRRLCLSHHLSL